MDFIATICLDRLFISTYEVTYDLSKKGFNFKMFTFECLKELLPYTNNKIFTFTFDFLF